MKRSTKTEGRNNNDKWRGLFTREELISNISFLFRLGAMLLIALLYQKITHAQTHSIILGRPTDTSITASILFDQNVQYYLEYGTVSGNYPNTTTLSTNTTGTPDEIDLHNLLPDTKYYYRLNYKLPLVALFTSTPEYTFQTQRAKGSTFMFTIEADEHLYDKKGVKDMYQVCLDNQAKDKPDFMLSLGDYTDRGGFGVEVLYTLLRLKLANPDRVHLARGNHEEVSLAARYGFLSEGRLKYGSDFDVVKVLRTYDFLPVVIWLGSGGNYIQCNHGGMEPGFDPRRLLGAAGPAAFQFIGTLTQRHFLTTHSNWFAPYDSRARAEYSRTALDFRPIDPINPVTLGFMWNDYTLASDEPGFAIDPGRAFVYGQSTTRYLLEQTRNGSNIVQAVFRGHQQSSAPNPMMRRLMAGHGVFRHWQKGDSSARFAASIRELEEFLETAPERAIPTGSVWTLNISPDSAYGEANGFDYDAFAILKTARNFADWRVNVINVDVPR